MKKIYIDQKGTYLKMKMHYCLVFLNVYMH